MLCTNCKLFAPGNFEIETRFSGNVTGDTFFGFKRVSGCRNSCRVCSALMAIYSAIIEYNSDRREGKGRRCWLIQFHATMPFSTKMIWRKGWIYIYCKKELLCRIMLWKNRWSSDHITPNNQIFQNGCSTKNFSSNHPCQMPLNSAAFDSVPHPAATILPSLLQYERCNV